MGDHHHEHSHADHVHTGHAVLDIGEDIGALIIYTPLELRGREIEVSPRGEDFRRVHTEVLERRVSGRTVFAALFLALQAGEYTIWKNPTEPGGSITIAGGEVAQVTWKL